MRYALILSLLLVTFCFDGICEDKFRSGLYFSSHEVIQDQRTSLNLTPEKQLSFVDGFTIDFEAKFRRKDGYYGYIFRMIGQNDVNLDLVSNFAVRKNNFSIIYKDQLVSSFGWEELNGADFDQWMTIRLEVDFHKSRLRFSMNGIVREIELDGIEILQNFNLIFGAVRSRLFPSLDVCPMLLRNIRIYDSKDKLIRFWELSRHAEGRVFDELNHSVATVENPNWLIDDHVHWKRIKDFHVDSLIGFASDTINDRLFLVDRQMVYKYDLLTQKLDTFSFRNGTPYMTAQGMQIAYNPFTDKLWSYNFDNSKISEFNLHTHEWSEDPGFVAERGYAHHSRLFSPLDSSFYTLFGYGFYRYKNDVFNYRNAETGWRKNRTIGLLEPRYLQGVALLNGKKLLVFGGYGSKTGKQEVAPRYFYDLYAFDLTTLNFSKLLDYPAPIEPYLPGASLVIDKSSDSFFTLVYDNSKFNTSITLAKFGIKVPTQQFYGDSIPFQFLDTESWTDLFMERKSNKLFAVTVHNSDISLFSIAYPPLLAEDVMQVESDEHFAFKYWKGTLVLITIVGAILLYLLFWRKKKHWTVVNNEVSGYGDVVKIVAGMRRQISSVLFFGGFQIFNRKGEDITSEFSPTLKQLFLIIFMSTFKNGRGISSSKLDELLWFDKAEKSARNNRNVNISKLRSALDDVGGMEIINENSFWRIQISDTVYCDYAEVLLLLRKAQVSELVIDEIKKLIGTISYGVLLPNLETEWFDAIKSAFANDLIDCLTTLLNSKEVEDSLKYNLAECIFVYDSLNEEALAVKCSVLNNLGKRSIAMSTYSLFCKEYKKLLGEDCPLIFKNLLNK